MDVFGACVMLKISKKKSATEKYFGTFSHKLSCVFHKYRNRF